MITIERTVFKLYRSLNYALNQLLHVCVTVNDENDSNKELELFEYLNFTLGVEKKIKP